MIGFIMMGSIFFLPIWFEHIKDYSATESGLQLIPMMFGLILASIVSGALVSKYGHYYTYPIVGGALLTLGSGLVKLFHPSSGQEHFIPILFVIGKLYLFSYLE